MTDRRLSLRLPACPSLVGRLVPLGSLSGRTLGRYPLHHNGLILDPCVFCTPKKWKPTEACDTVKLMTLSKVACEGSHVRNFGRLVLSTFYPSPFQGVVPTQHRSNLGLGSYGGLLCIEPRCICQNLDRWVTQSIAIPLLHVTHTRKHVRQLWPIAPLPAWSLLRYQRDHLGRWAGCRHHQQIAPIALSQELDSKRRPINDHQHTLGNSLSIFAICFFAPCAVRHLAQSLSSQKH